MAILQQQRTGYNPQTDMHLEKLSWKLMDLHYGGIRVMRSWMRSRTRSARSRRRRSSGSIRTICRRSGRPSGPACSKGRSRRRSGQRKPRSWTRRPMMSADLCGADIPFLVTA